MTNLSLIKINILSIQTLDCSVFPVTVNKLRWHTELKAFADPGEDSYREELELERERWRLRPGDLERERLLTGDLRLGDRDLWLVCNKFVQIKKKKNKFTNNSNEA